MLFLLVDTAGSVGGVLLARNEGEALDLAETEVLGERRLEPREFSTQLVPAIAELLQASRLRLSNLDTFAVVSGPGSFTGLRIGLSAVKAMAEVTAKPVVALSRLAIMASAADVSFSSGHTQASVHVVLDAGRGEFYHGIYRDGGRTRIAESLETPAALIASIKRVDGLVAASDAVVLDAIGRWPDVDLRTIGAVTVREMLPLVLSSWRSSSFSDVALLDANYLRRLDVEGLSSTPAVAQPANPRAGGL